MAVQDYAAIKSGNTINWETLITLLQASLGTYDLVLIPTNGGWIVDPNTWTYSSATSNSGTFTISGDHTARLKVGMKVWYTQTSSKYGVIKSSTYSAPNTTVVITGGTSYVLANAAITSPYYTYVEMPAGYPDWFADSSITPTGFSSGGTAYYRFTTKGRMATVAFTTSANGTSNATSYTIPLTITAASNNVNYLSNSWTGTDAGSYQNNVLATISAGASSIALNPQGGSVNWTASGAKGATGMISYEF